MGREVESGKRNDRVALAGALKLCRQQKATLVIAKLDRLARNVHFISGLMESGVEFVAVDMPEANRLRPWRPRRPAERSWGGVSAERFAEIAASGRQSWSATASKGRAGILPLIEEVRTGGATSLREIASELNARGEMAPRGGQWSAVQVMRVIGATSALPIAD